MALAVLSAVVLAACSNWKGDVAPDGHAIVREHTLYAPGNEPPIWNTLDFTIVSIDDKPVVRETIPRWVDMQPGALLPAGSHNFKASLRPAMRRPGDEPKEVTFTATVESRKVYYLVGKDGQPVLIEAHAKAR